MWACPEIYTFFILVCYWKGLLIGRFLLNDFLSIKNAISNCFFLLSDLMICRHDIVVVLVIFPILLGLHWVGCIYTAENTGRGEYLIKEKNYLDAVIGLPANIFYGTSIPTCILVLKKKRTDAKSILFIDDLKDDQFYELYSRRKMYLSK